MQNRERPLFYINPNIPQSLYNLIHLKGVLCRIKFKNIIKNLIAITGLLLVIVESSCTATKDQVFFKTLQKDTTLKNLVSKNYDLKIQKGDMLGIAVASLSPDVAFYNAPQNTVGPVSGHLVDEYGNISFLKLGTLHAEGLTRKNLKDTLQAQLIPYLKDIVVSVSFLNRHVTMLGAAGPTVVPLLSDNMTLLDALAASGDISQKGKMTNVLVIREQDDNKVFKRINLEDQSIFYSPYYYLQPNDIVYVEPKRVTTPITAQAAISYVVTAISLFVLISKL